MRHHKPAVPNLVTSVACGLAALASLLLASVAVAAPPANDDFANATAISGLPVNAAGKLLEATQEPGEPYENGGYSVWWRWTAPSG